MPHVIHTEAELRALIGYPGPIARAKQIAVLDAHCKAFIAESPMLMLSTANAIGRCDVSPRGDMPGFVQILDDHHLLIPERPGNRRADTFTNVLQHPSVALLCFVPGMDETMRINGQAHITIDPELLSTMAVEGHVPSVALVVEVEEAFIHCGKALARGRVWDPEARIDRSVYPSVAEVMFDHGNLERLGYTRDDLIECARDDYATNVYPADED